METKKSKITVRNLARSFYSPKGEKIEALKDVNFEVEDAFSPSCHGCNEGRLRLLSSRGESLGQFQYFPVAIRLGVALVGPDCGIGQPGRELAVEFHRWQTLLGESLKATDDIASEARLEGGVQVEPCNRGSCATEMLHEGGPRRSQRDENLVGRQASRGVQAES